MDEYPLDRLTDDYEDDLFFEALDDSDFLYLDEEDYPRVGEEAE